MIENANRMNMEWNIRREIFEVLHGWPRIALVFLLGSFLGWIVGNVLPGQYRAEFEMYVAYSADRIYRNPDDYKNWQLSELEIYIYSDDMLNSTLERLQQLDAYWSQFTITDIRPGLHTYWRNAGKWRLVAEWDQPDRAAQIASAWGATVVEKTKVAIQQGGMAQELADRIRAFSREEVIVSQRAARLAQTAQSLAAWKTTALQTSTGQTLTTLERWKLQSLAAGLADLNPSAEILLDQFPLPDATHREVVPWVELAELTVADELAAMQVQEADLAVRRDQLTHQWEAAMAASRNLTVDLLVEQIANIAPEGVVVRNSAQISLAGGVLSLLVFALGWLAIARRRARR